MTNSNVTVPLALLIFAVLVLLLWTRRLTGRQFVTALLAIPLVVGILVLIALRPHDVQELSGKVGAKGAEVVLKMEKIKQDIFARADTVQRLTEKSGEIAAFNVVQHGGLLLRTDTQSASGCVMSCKACFERAGSRKSVCGRS